MPLSDLHNVASIRKMLRPSSHAVASIS